MTPNTIPVVLKDNRKLFRNLVTVKAVIRRIHPPLPTRLTLYTKDLTTSGTCLLVTDSIVWIPGDLILLVFVIEMNPTTTKRSNLIQLKWRQGNVIWSLNGRIGVEFLRNSDGYVWTR